MIRSHPCSHRTEQLPLPVAPHTLVQCLPWRFTRNIDAECCRYASMNLLACAGKQESGLRGAPAAKFPLYSKGQRHSLCRMRYSARILAAAGTQTYPSVTSKPYFRRMHAHAQKPLRSAPEPGALLPTAWRIFAYLDTCAALRVYVRISTIIYACSTPAMRHSKLFHVKQYGQTNSCSGERHAHAEHSGQSIAVGNADFRVLPKPHALLFERQAQDFSARAGKLFSLLRWPSIIRRAP